MVFYNGINFINLIPGYNPWRSRSISTNIKVEIPGEFINCYLYVILSAHNHKKESINFL